MSPIGQFILSLVGRAVSNQITKQVIHDEVKELDTKIKEDSDKKDQIISSLDSKLKSLEDEVDKKVALKIDEIVKKIQDKVPFFVDPFVAQAGEAAKVELDKVTDDLVSSIISLLGQAEDKLKDVTGIKFGDVKEPSNDKFEEKTIPNPEDEEEGD